MEMKVMYIHIQHLIQHLLYFCTYMLKKLVKYFQRDHHFLWPLQCVWVLCFCHSLSVMFRQLCPLGNSIQCCWWLTPSLSYFTSLWLMSWNIFMFFPYYASFSLIDLDIWHILLVDCAVFSPGNLSFIFPTIAV